MDMGQPGEHEGFVHGTEIGDAKKVTEYTFLRFLGALAADRNGASCVCTGRSVPTRLRKENLKRL